MKGDAVKFIIIAIVLLAILVVGFVIWRYIATIRAGARQRQRILEMMSPLGETLADGDPPDPVLLHRFAANTETCKVLWEVLEAYERLDAFPDEHRTWEHLAKADITFWLGHPNELGASPDELKLMTTVESPSATTEQPAVYYVFRYRVHEPHWAAKDGWMAAIAGPYDPAGDPYPHGPGTFSRFESWDSRTPEKHVRVTHEALFGKPA